MFEGWATRVKEARPAPSIKVDYFASPESFGGLYRAIYQGPQIGVKFVRRRDGSFATYECPEKAKLAACDAYKWAVNNQPEPMRATRDVIMSKRRELRRGA
jgi:hypothetical protein